MMMIILIIVKFLSSDHRCHYDTNTQCRNYYHHLIVKILMMIAMMII